MCPTVLIFIFCFICFATCVLLLFIFLAQIHPSFKLKRIVENQKFRINDEKNRIQSRKYRQEVTGLVVNKKLNVTKRYVKQLRMWIYLWEQYGYDKAYGYFLRDYKQDKGHVKSTTPLMENVIAGKLDYYKMIVGENNQSYLQLKNRLDQLMNGDNVIQALNNKKENINIDYNNGYLNISATKEEIKEENNNYIRKEKLYGTYKRSYYVGKIDEESIKASYNNGVLMVNFNELKEIENKKTINID